MRQAQKSYRRCSTVKNAISDKKTKCGDDYLDGTGSGPAGEHGRRVAGSEPQRETAAMGTPEPAAQERVAHDRRSDGNAANPRGLAGAAADATQRIDRRGGTHR